MGTQVAVITPSLYLGESAGAEHLAGVYEASDVAEAMLVICSGGTALLPPARWDLAVGVLLELGLNEDEVAERIRLAKTGPASVGTFDLDQA
jgi:hypothetical protein